MISEYSNIIIAICTAIITIITIGSIFVKMFNKIEKRFDKIDQKFENIYTELKILNQRISTLEGIFLVMNINVHDARKSNLINSKNKEK